MTGTTLPDSIWQGCQTWQEKFEGLYILDCPMSFTMWKVSNDVSNDVAMKSYRRERSLYHFRELILQLLWNVSANNPACSSVTFINPIYYKQNYGSSDNVGSVASGESVD